MLQILKDKKCPNYKLQTTNWKLIFQFNSLKQLFYLVSWLM